MTHSRRIGRFFVASPFVDESNLCLQRLMSKIVVLRADYAPWRDGFEYVAICDDFEVCPHGLEPPVYEVICHSDPIAVTFERRPY
jgi:hypothetical protein